MKDQGLGCKFRRIQPVGSTLMGGRGVEYRGYIGVI